MEKEITNFELQYDGMYHIQWTEGDKVNKWYIYLSIPELLRMLEIEGLTFEELSKPAYQYTPIKFEKVKLRYTLNDDHFLAYGFFDEHLGNTLKENFSVELFPGDTIENHKHETILGYVELVDDGCSDE
ncbi:MAG: hypothetical protein EA361_13260 [Bacteroidetes bacterium]|nr:MAG: hypothetical protein EA361_13260 [Bacteroidota bacterium]